MDWNGKMFEEKLTVGAACFWRFCGFWRELEAKMRFKFHCCVAWIVAFSGVKHFVVLKFAHQILHKQPKVQTVYICSPTFSIYFEAAPASSGIAARATDWFSNAAIFCLPSFHTAWAKVFASSSVSPRGSCSMDLFVLLCT
jgi:hypothetical protein